jgi:hypothetical protein
VMPGLPWELAASPNLVILKRTTYISFQPAGWQPIGQPRICQLALQIDLSIPASF